MAYKVYYDKVASGTTATELTFFTHNEADDGELVTNIPSDNKLPENVTINRIELIPAGGIAEADAHNLLTEGILKIIIKDTEVLKFPAALAFSDNHVRLDAYVEAGNTGTAAEKHMACVGTLGGIEIPGGIQVPKDTRFNVKLVLGSAFSADTNLVLALHCTTQE